MLGEITITNNNDATATPTDIGEALLPVWRPIDLEKIDQAQMHWLNTLALAQTNYTATIDDKQLVLKLDRQPPVESDLRRYSMQLPIEIAGEYCIIELQHCVLEKEINRYASSELIAELPSTLLVEILNEVYRPLIEQLSIAIASHVKLLPATVPLRPLLDSCSLAFTLSDNAGITTDGRLSFEKSMQVFFGGTLRRDARECRLVEDICRVQARCVIGSQYFTSEEIGELSKGDVLLYDLQSDEERPLRLSLQINNRLQYKAEYNSKGIKIMSEEQYSSIVKSVQVNDIEELSVRLDFDIGDLALSITELRDLRPGVILELEKDKHSLVTIRNNGRAIAEAELVEIEGLIGVRICKMAN